MDAHLEVSWCSDANTSLPNLIEECTVSLGNSPAHSQRVVLVDVFQVRLVSSLSLDKVLSQGGSVTQTLHEGEGGIIDQKLNLFFSASCCRDILKELKSRTFLLQQILTHL